MYHTGSVQLYNPSQWLGRPLVRGPDPKAQGLPPVSQVWLWLPDSSVSLARHWTHWRDTPAVPCTPTAAAAAKQTLITCQARAPAVMGSLMAASNVPQCSCLSYMPERIPPRAVGWNISCFHWRVSEEASISIPPPISSGNWGATVESLMSLIKGVQK